MDYKKHSSTVGFRSFLSRFSRVFHDVCLSFIYIFSYPLLTFIFKTKKLAAKFNHVFVMKKRFLMLLLVLLSTHISFDCKTKEIWMRNKVSINTTTTLDSLMRDTFSLTCMHASNFNRDNFFIRWRRDKMKFSHKSCLITFWIKSYLS